MVTDIWGYFYACYLVPRANQFWSPHPGHPVRVGKKIPGTSYSYGLNHLELLSHNRGAHKLQQIILCRGMEIKATGMVCRIAMQVTESLLALTSDTRKCELLLTTRMCTLSA